MGLALADAFDSRRVQGMDLRSALARRLLAHAPCQHEQMGERRFEPLSPSILRVMSRMTRPAQLLQHPVGEHELLGMGNIALVLNQGEL
ncbi:MAG: hypothetical protein NVS1B11_37620 [Terriglobales bacterium]